MSRLKKLFQPVLMILLVMAALISCGTTPPATASDTASTDVKDTATAPLTNAATTDTKDTATATVPDSGTTPAKTAQETVPHDTYVVQPGDVLGISVWKERDLQGDMPVRPDGGLNFPLVGEIIAAGKTIEQLKADITARLAKYVPDPVVTVIVKQAQGNKIYVVGQVNKPGDFIVNRNIDVMQALSMAGGPNPFAAVNKIKILRRVNGEQKTFLFKYSQVEKGKNLEQNIVLQGGDIVVVP